MPKKIKCQGIAAVILGKSPVRDSSYAKKSGADILELRLDQFKSLDAGYLCRVIKEIKKKTHLPLIGTLRLAREEKFLPLRHRISEGKRFDVISAVLPLVDFVDVELRARITGNVLKRAHALKKKVIISYHNFRNTPSLKELRSIAGNAKRYGADIVKIAAFAKSREEVARLMAFAYISKIRPIVVLSMGRCGSVSRLIAPVFGSSIIYASAAKKSAPGQLSLKDVKKYIGFIS